MAIYRCNPSKHKHCKKTACQRDCFHTVFQEYSIDGIPREWREDKDGKVKDLPIEKEKKREI